MTLKVLLMSMCVMVAGCTSSNRADQVPDLRQQVFDTERAFADTMARRDFEAFKTFLADETVFFSGETALRGKQKVADAWQGFFVREKPPFSWQPTAVEVLDSGTLALSTGPVYDPDGNLVGIFNSIWRREARGQWRIVFDKGGEVCPAP